MSGTKEKISLLLPGEDVVTKGSFVSIGWRLVPYFLNNWEKQWGAECSSMLFELPHYALELLVVLPLVQVCPSCERWQCWAGCSLSTIMINL